MRYYKNADRIVDYLFEPQWRKRPKDYGQDGYLEEQLAKQGVNWKPVGELVTRVESTMTQDERWLERYTEVKDFIESNHRNPSRHNPEERFKYCNWLKHNKKLLNAGEMK